MNRIAKKGLPHTSNLPTLTMDDICNDITIGKMAVLVWG